MKNTILFNNMNEDIQQQFIEKAYNYLVNMNRIAFLDDPIEDHPEYILICKVAEEYYSGDRT